MKKSILIVSSLILALTIWVNDLPKVAAAPLAQEGNLLTNGGFEQPFVNGAAEGWTSWFLQKEKQDEECLSGYQYKPKWNVETGGSFVNGGVTSQYVGNNWDTWSGGVSQTVDVAPGVTYRFTFAAKGRASNEGSPEPSDTGVNMNVRAGIDPNGSGQWNDADVVWGASTSPHDAWQQVSVETTATGERITVFTSANFGVPNVNQCRQFMDTWYDQAELVAVSAAPAPTRAPAPAATETPAAVAELEPTAPVVEPTTVAVADAPEEPQQDTEPEPEQPSEVAEPAGMTGGTICVNAFYDEDANGLHDASEGFMAGVTFSVASQSAIVGQAISDGTDLPTCFHGLAPGAYQVAQEVPGRLEITTAANAVVSVADNMTTGLEFGSRLRQEEPVTAPEAGAAEVVATVAEAAQAPSETGGFDLLAVSGLVVILVGVVLLGALLFFLLRGQ